MVQRTGRVMLWRMIHATKLRLLLAAVAAAAVFVLPGGAGAQAAPCVAKLRAPGHHPKANRLWPITVTCLTTSGKPVRATATYKFVYNGQVVATRYPSPKADPKSPANKITFNFAGGSNLDPKKDKHMHGATLTIVDNDHIELDGLGWEDGKPAKEMCGQMKLVRKK